MTKNRSLSRRRLIRTSSLCTFVGLSGCVDQVPSEILGGQSGEEDAERLGVFAEDDPGRHSYPPDPSSRDEEILGSNYIEERLWELYTAYRAERGKEDLFPNASLDSVAAQHSYYLATEGYMGINSPDGTPPESQYDDLEVICTDVRRFIRRTSVTVVEDGERTGITESEVAETLFASLTEDREAQEALELPKSEAASAGIGVFLSPVEEGDTVNIDVYLTVDICHGFTTDEQQYEE